MCRYLRAKPPANFRCAFGAELKRRGSRGGEGFNQTIEIFLALVKRFHADALVLAVGAHIEDVIRQPGVAIGGDPGFAQEASVGRAGRHGRQERNARPEFRRELFDGGVELGARGRRGTGHVLGIGHDLDLVIGEDAQTDQCFDNMRILMEQAGGTIDDVVLQWVYLNDFAYQPYMVDVYLEAWPIGQYQAARKTFRYPMGGQIQIQRVLVQAFDLLRENSAEGERRKCVQIEERDFACFIARSRDTTGDLAHEEHLVR